MNDEERALIDRLIDREGGYVNDPNDRGGATNMGVTQGKYDEWRRKKGLPLKDVKDLDVDEAHNLYYEDFLVGPKLQKVASGPLLELLFDSAVNHGPWQAVKWLQRAVHAKDDGIIGPNTIGKVQEIQEDHRLLYVDVLTRRYEFYGQIITQNRHPYYHSARIWMKRMTEFTYNALNVT